MRTSTFMIMGGGVLAAMTVKWADLRSKRTVGDVHRAARAGRIRSTMYSTITTMASLFFMVFGTYLAFAGE